MDSIHQQDSAPNTYQVVKQASKTRRVSPTSSNLHILPEPAAIITDRNSGIATTVVNSPKQQLLTVAGDEDDLTLENTTDKNTSPKKPAAEILNMKSKGVSKFQN